LATKVKKSRATLGKAARIMTEINSTLQTPVLKLGNDDFFKVIRIPSGSLAIDRITGGGFALGRHIELYGDESVCKSYIAYRTMALSQRRGNVCALIDPEHSFDPKWFRHLGGVPEELITAQPEIAEDAIEAMMLLFKQGVEVITVDSVAALATKEEAARRATDEAKIASQARFMSQQLRRLTTYNEKTLVLWTNQNRTKIGMFFGNPTSQPGGRALKFYDTARIELKRGKKITKKAQKATQDRKLVSGMTQSGHWVLARAHKNKVSREGLEATFVFDNERGQIDPVSEIIQLGLEDGLIVRSGNTFSYVDYDDVEWKGNEKKFRQLIAENDGIRDELIADIETHTLELAQPGGSVNNSDETDEGDEE
jgi:recombination protein RecA